MLLLPPPRVPLLPPPPDHLPTAGVSRRKMESCKRIYPGRGWVACDPVAVAAALQPSLITHSQQVSLGGAGCRYDLAL